MGIELIVLDFDGTLTKIYKESVPVIKAWKEDVGKDLGLSISEIEQRWSATQIKIESNPSNYGWIRDGKIIAPASADPLVMATVITQILFDEEDKYLDPFERENMIQTYLFYKNHKKAEISFKDEADLFLAELKSRFPIYIVTNSEAKSVIDKIKHLPTNHNDIPVYGNAKKYDLTPEWSDVPESTEREGFNRPLFLQRQKYWNILSQIMGKRGHSPEQVAVVGDIYEMDLLLPEYQGMNIILISHNTTTDFELQAVASYKRGYVAKTLGEALEHLESL